MLLVFFSRCPLVPRVSRSSLALCPSLSRFHLSRQPHNGFNFGLPRKLNLLSRSPFLLYLALLFLSALMSPSPLPLACLLLLLLATFGSKSFYTPKVGKTGFFSDTSFLLFHSLPFSSFLPFPHLLFYLSPAKIRTGCLGICSGYSKKSTLLCVCIFRDSAAAAAAAAAASTLYQLVSFFLSFFFCF
jgi:hypothetical protein